MRSLRALKLLGCRGRLEQERRAERAHPPVKSLLVCPLANGAELGIAAAFATVHDARSYLVTNWHVVEGRRYDNGNALAESKAIPDSLLVWHNVAGQLGHWSTRVEPLYDDLQCTVASECGKLENRSKQPPTHNPRKGLRMAGRVEQGPDRQRAGPHAEPPTGNRR